MADWTADWEADWSKGPVVIAWGGLWAVVARWCRGGGWGFAFGWVFVDYDGVNGPPDLACRGHGLGIRYRCGGGAAWNLVMTLFRGFAGAVATAFRLLSYASRSVSNTRNSGESGLWVVHVHYEVSVHPEIHR